MKQAASIQKLLDELERLPGIGPKSAQRIAYYILNEAAPSAQRLADAIYEVKETVHFCPVCFNYATGDVCEICAAGQVGERDTGIICVVSEPRDIGAIERTHEFRGLYHVLGGVISPMEGIGPDDLTVRQLLGRLEDPGITEVLLATDPNVEGDTTALYLSRIIKPLGVRVTRLASGLPAGGDLEFADELTLSRAIEARREM